MFILLSLGELACVQAIVFFPNIFHETHVPEDNPECTVAALPARRFLA